MSRTLAKAVAALECLMALLGLLAWWYDSSFWGGASALLALWMVLAQLPVFLCGLIAYARRRSSGESRGLGWLFAGTILLCLWNVFQWFMFFMGHQ